MRGACSRMRRAEMRMRRNAPPKRQKISWKDAVASCRRRRQRGLTGLRHRMGNYLLLLLLAIARQGDELLLLVLLSLAARHVGNEGMRCQLTRWGLSEGKKRQVSMGKKKRGWWLRRREKERKRAEGVGGPLRGWVIKRWMDYQKKKGTYLTGLEREKMGKTEGERGREGGKERGESTVVSSERGTGAGEWVYGSRRKQRE